MCLSGSRGRTIQLSAVPKPGLALYVGNGLLKGKFDYLVKLVASASWYCD